MASWPRDGLQLWWTYSGPAEKVLSLKASPYQQCLSDGFFVCKIEMTDFQLLRHTGKRVDVKEFVIVECPINVSS